MKERKRENSKWKKSGRTYETRESQKHFYKVPKKRYCRFCSDSNTTIDYKNVSLLRGFLTERAKIIPRRNSGNCAKHQKELTVALKRARFLALVPYTVS